MELTDWLRLGWVREHRTSRREIADLLAVADRDLQACRLPGLDVDWQLTIAYNAALQVATAALAACGYRAERASHHYRVIQSLEMTMGRDAALVDQLDAYRRKRNQSAYERAGIASQGEAEGMVDLALQRYSTLLAWLESEHPDLVAPGAD